MPEDTVNTVRTAEGKRNGGLTGNAPNNPPPAVHNTLYERL